jgi:hypothetical protein
MEFSRCARANCPPFEEPLAGERSLKAQQRAAPNGAGNVEVDVIPGEPGHRTAWRTSHHAIDEPSARRSKSSGIP